MDSQSKYFLGIDPSPKTFGAVVLAFNGIEPLADYRYYDDTQAHSIVELSSKLERFFFWLGGLHKEIKLTVLEGYVFNSKFLNIGNLEIGALLRYFLVQRGYQYGVVQPTSLKKFIANTGKADKKQILKFVEEKLKFNYGRNDHLADACVLAFMAALSSKLGINKEVIVDYYGLSIEKVFVLEKLWRTRWLINQ